MITLKYILIMTCAGFALSQNCIVDKCRVCPDTTNINCTSCDEGYYLKTFSGGNKTYNACWKTSNLIWLLLGALASSLAVCYCFKLCFDIGKKEVNQLEPRHHLTNSKKKKVNYSGNSTLLSTARSNRNNNSQLVTQIP